jgi:hypothetical protein
MQSGPQDPQHRAIQKRQQERNEFFCVPATDAELAPLQQFRNGKDLPGFLEYVKMFSIIGALVLLIACINFINLTTARSEKRARRWA